MPKVEKNIKDDIKKISFFLDNSKEVETAIEKNRITLSAFLNFSVSMLLGLYNERLIETTALRNLRDRADQSTDSNELKDIERMMGKILLSSLEIYQQAEEVALEKNSNALTQNNKSKKTTNNKQNFNPKNMEIDKIIKESLSIYSRLNNQGLIEQIRQLAHENNRNIEGITEDLITFALNKYNSKK